MELRLLGRTGLRVSALTLGTMTFGGAGRFGKIGATQVDEARELIDLCLEAGVNLFDTADIYSDGLSEEILGQALGKRRDQVLVATKLNGRMGDGPNDAGSTRHHVVRACEASLRRLGTDWIDLYQVHGVDELTAMEQTLRALDDLVRAGKVRYVGCSNFSGWHLMKALGISGRLDLERYASLQAYYSLVARELEWELVPLCLDQDVGILVWSPLSGGFLSGKFRRDTPAVAGTRRTELGSVPMDEERGFRVVDALDEIARERGVSVAQVALNWLLRKPGVTSLVVGARNREQLADNLAAATWELTPEEVAALDEVSTGPLPYPYWHQRLFNAERLRERP